MTIDRYSYSGKWACAYVGPRCVAKARLQVDSKKQVRFEIKTLPRGLSKGGFIAGLLAARTPEGQPLVKGEARRFLDPPKPKAEPAAKPKPSKPKPTKD